MKRNLPDFHINYIDPNPGVAKLMSMSLYASSFLGINIKKLHEIVRSKKESDEYCLKDVVIVVD